MAEGKSKTGVVKKRASKREKKDWIAAYIFIAPVTLGLLVFYIWPFIQNIWFSFNEVSKFNVATFCGLANYQKLFHDGEVLRTFGNTLKYVVVTVPVGLFLSILIAALLNSTIECKSNDFRKPYDSYLYSHRTPSETWKENRVITEVC